MLAVYGGGYRYACRQMRIESGESCLSTALETFSAGDWIVVVIVLAVFALIGFVMLFPSDNGLAADDSANGANSPQAPPQAPYRATRPKPRSRIPDAD